MPTTIRREQRDNFVIGVDGCRSGWVFARLNLDDSAVTAGLEPDFRAIIDDAVAEQVGYLDNQPCAHRNSVRRL